MGLGAQLTIWPDALFEGLAKRGFYVIRYDNRDTGLSTDFGSWGVPNIPAALQKVMKGEKVDAPYLLKDMAADAIGLLDALGIQRAHMVGASMGGMIVQIVAAQYPAAHALDGLDLFDQRPARPAAGQARGAGHADGAARRAGARAAGQARHEAAPRPSAARAIPTPEAELRAFVEKNVDRRWYPEGAARQYLVGHRLGRSRRAAEDDQGADPGAARRGRSAAAGRVRPRRREPGARRARSRPIPAGATTFPAS